jgi:hypothetical protein
MQVDKPRLYFEGGGSRAAALELTFPGVSARDAAGQALLAEALRAFVAAGGAGGYPLADVVPALSHLLLTADLTSRQGTFSCRLDAAQVTPNAFQLLRNLLSRQRSLGLPVEEVVVRDVTARNAPRHFVPQPKDEDEDDLYPPVSTRLGFQLVEAEETPTGKMRRCHVEFAEPLQAAHVQAVERCARPWFALLIGGAFALPVEWPGEADCMGSEVTVFDEATVEVCVDRFVSSENAWNVLVNLLAARDRKAFPVVAVHLF